MAEELKACDYCKALPALRHIIAGPQVRCENCLCSGPAISTAEAYTDEDHTECARKAVHAWNARAQPPSQGGEAVEVVGWRRLDRPYELTAYPSVCAMWHGAGYPVQALYTHPADQVADDLTMVKVPRELLQDLRDLASDAVEHHRQAFAGYKQTRQASMDSVIRDADALLAKSEGVKP